MGKITFCFSHDSTGQSQEGNQVWDRHETIYDVSQDPDGFQLQESAEANEDDENNALRHDALDAK